MSTLSTNNWDTAFGITFKAANLAIVKQASSPASFTGTHTDMGQTTSVRGDFGDWQLSGGAGSLLLMTLPLKSGTVQGTGDPAAYAGHAAIQVNLAFIPQPGAPKQILGLDVKAGATVLSVTLSAGPAAANDAIKGALSDWLSANLDQFNHVFAAVDLNDKADKGDFTWLAPTHLGYAINADGIANIDEYLFGVLAMTDHRVGKALTPVLDPGIIPVGSDAGFLIGAPLVMDEMFRPHIQTLFGNATPADFDTLDDGMSLYNTKELALPNFTLSDGHLVTDAGVKSDGFNLSIGAGAVVITFTGLTFTYRPGYTVVVNYRSVDHLGTDSHGNLQLTPSGVPTVTMSIEEATGQKWKEIWEGVGIGIIGAVVGAVLGGLAEAGLAAREAATAAIQAGEEAGEAADLLIEMDDINQPFQDRVEAQVTALRSAVNALRAPEAPMTFVGFFRANAFKLLGAAIGAAVGGGLASIPIFLDGYAEEDRNKMPTLDDFTAKAIGSTTWTGGSGYTLTSAQLRGALQLGLTAAQ